jgi:hypothetical protein
MLGLLFPRLIDNRFRGQWLGYWLLAPVLVLKFGIAFASILTPRQANKADAIDLSTYSQTALRDAATSTALLGLLHLCIGLFCLLAMIRYRARFRWSTSGLWPSSWAGASSWSSTRSSGSRVRRAARRSTLS